MSNRLVIANSNHRVVRPEAPGSETTQSPRAQSGRRDRKVRDEDKSLELEIPGADEEALVMLSDALLTGSKCRVQPGSDVAVFSVALHDLDQPPLLRMFLD